MTMRCLNCLGFNVCASWCRTQLRPEPIPVTSTRIMPVIPAEMPVEPPVHRRRTPGWAVASLGLGLILVGLALLTFAVVNEITGGGVEWANLRTATNGR